MVLQGDPSWFMDAAMFDAVRPQLLHLLGPTQRTLRRLARAMAAVLARGGVTAASGDDSRTWCVHKRFYCDELGTGDCYKDRQWHMRAMDVLRQQSADNGHIFLVFSNQPDTARRLLAPGAGRHNRTRVRDMVFVELDDLNDWEALWAMACVCNIACAMYVCAVV